MVDFDRCLGYWCLLPLAEEDGCRLLLAKIRLNELNDNTLKCLSASEEPFSELHFQLIWQSDRGAVCLLRQSTFSKNVKKAS